MTYTLLPLKVITPNLLPRIAKIQLEDAGLLSKLGYSFVLRYFEMAVKDERAFGFYAQENETGEIMGFSLASPEPSAPAPGHPPAERREGHWTPTTIGSL